jgi:hypothetical protein
MTLGLGLLFGCAAAVEPADDEDVESVSAAITNGTTVPDDFSGVLAMQVFSQTWNSWATFCTATLMNNNKAITAKHCFDDMDSDPRPKFAKMGSQRIAIVKDVRHPSLDIAAFKLASPMQMWNFSVDHFVGIPALTTSDYARGAYTGTNASLDGRDLFCYGEGGASASNPQPALTTATLPATFQSDHFNPLNEIHVHKRNNQLEQAGDSGGPCLSGSSVVADRLVFPLSGCFYSGFNFCYGPGAQDWALWAYAALLNL